MGFRRRVGGNKEELEKGEEDTTSPFANPFGQPLVRAAGTGKWRVNKLFLNPLTPGSWKEKKGEGREDK